MARHHFLLAYPISSAELLKTHCASSSRANFFFEFRTRRFVVAGRLRPASEGPASTSSIRPFAAFTRPRRPCCARFKKHPGGEPAG